MRDDGGHAGQDGGQLLHAGRATRILLLLPCSRAPAILHHHPFPALACSRYNCVPGKFQQTDAFDTYVKNATAIASAQQDLPPRTPPARMADWPVT